MGRRGRIGLLSVWCCNLYGGGGCIKRAEGMEIDNKTAGRFFLPGVGR